MMDDRNEVMINTLLKEHSEFERELQGMRAEISSMKLRLALVEEGGSGLE